jgi:hypothetical protein
MEEADGGEPIARGKGLAGGVVGAVAWLASALGVFGALLYACGYLISVAQLHLLGLGRLMSYGHDYYVQQGGSFLADLGSTFAIVAEPFSLIVIGLAVVGFGIALLWRRTRLAQGRWAERIGRLHDRTAALWPRLAYAVLVYLLLFRYGDPLEFGLPLTLSNVLFTDPSAATAPELATMHRLLLSGDRDGLGAMFEARLLTYVVVCLLLLASHYVTLRWRWRRLALSPFVLLFALYSLLLPMLYGVLKLQVEFPVVMVWPGGEAKSQHGERSFLLDLGDGEAVFYVASERKVTWRRRDSIDRIEVIGTAAILREITSPKSTP